jgi:hypothetical protein
VDANLDFGLLNLKTALGRVEIYINFVANNCTISLTGKMLRNLLTSTLIKQGETERSVAVLSSDIFNDKNFVRLGAWARIMVLVFFRLSPQLIQLTLNL